MIGLVFILLALLLVSLWQALTGQWFSSSIRGPLK
jgi:hypothetical protein